MNIEKRMKKSEGIVTGSMIGLFTSLLMAGAAASNGFYLLLIGFTVVAIFMAHIHYNEIEELYNLEIERQTQ